MSANIGLPAPANNPYEGPLPIDEAIVAPIMGAMLPLTPPNITEMLARLSQLNLSLHARNATNLSIARQYRHLLHTTTDSLETLYPAITRRDRTSIRSLTSRLAALTEKARMHVGNSSARLGRTGELMRRLSQEGQGREVEEAWFREVQREMSVAVAEEESAGVCLEIGAGEVEGIVVVLGELVEEMEQRRRREVEREWVRMDLVEEGVVEGEAEAGRDGGGDDGGVVGEVPVPVREDENGST